MSDTDALFKCGSYTLSSGQNGLQSGFAFKVPRRQISSRRQSSRDRGDGPDLKGQNPTLKGQ